MKSLDSVSPDAFGSSTTAIASHVRLRLNEHVHVFVRKSSGGGTLSNGSTLPTIGPPSHPASRTEPRVGNATGEFPPEAA